MYGFALHRLSQRASEHCASSVFSEGVIVICIDMGTGTWGGLGGLVKVIKKEGRPAMGRRGGDNFCVNYTVVFINLIRI
jgi:hypothetical protein